MGCDIHLHTEIKVDGKWVHYSKCDFDRDYTLFSHMAGVRNHDKITPIAPPKGFPCDATQSTQIDFDYWLTDAHTPSWFDAAEIHVLYKRYLDVLNIDQWDPTHNEGYLFGNSWDIVRYPDDTPDIVEDVRWIFWFDN